MYTLININESKLTTCPYRCSLAFFSIGERKQLPKYVDNREGFFSQNYLIDALVRIIYTMTLVKWLHTNTIRLFLDS